jgi:FkbM family methyltransferase
LTQAVEEVRATKKGKKIKVLDVGANVGYISMWIAGTGDDVRVISVEPHPFHNSLFEKSLNFAGNAGLSKKIQLHKVALSTENEAGQTLCMKVHPTNAAMTYIAKAAQASGNDPGKDLPCTHVAVTTMDKILNDGKVKIDFMKIDVEYVSLRGRLTQRKRL